MSKKLEGQVAVVTGASKGIGAAIAEDLAAAGAAVVVNYASSKSRAEAVVQRIRQTDGKAVAVQADVSKPDDIRRLFAETKKAFGKLDILVNNAGIYEFAPLEAISAEHFHKQFDLNVLGLLLTAQEAVKHFGPSGGNIVNISSVVATSAPPNTSVYSALKAAVVAITRSLAQGAGGTQDPRQRCQPRNGRNRGPARRRHLRQRFPKADRRASTCSDSAGSVSRRTLPQLWYSWHPLNPPGLRVKTFTFQGACVETFEQRTARTT